MIVKRPGCSGKVRVTFSMPAGIWADTIYLVGDFNGWSKTATPLHLDEQSWNVSLELEAGKVYQYRYLVNGKDWYNDWRADRYEPNELGGDNSVVVALLEREVSQSGVSDARPYYGSRGNSASPINAMSDVQTTDEVSKRKQRSYTYAPV